MERSVELEYVCRRIIDGFERFDSSAYADMWHDDVALLIGSDADEWWTGSEDVRALIHAQFRAMLEAHPEPAPWEVREVEAWSAESFGWAAAKSVIHLSDGSELDVRMTAVFVLERGAWRLTHVHISHAVPNTTDLPTSIEQIIEAVARERVDLSSLAPPSGWVTVMFTDIESSTELAASMGDVAWFELLQRHDGVLEACMEGRRGSIIKSIGDGAMLAFESNAEALIFARELRSSLASELQGSGVRFRIGAHCGDAIHHNDDLFGTTVNMAARVTSAAEGDETLVSTAVRDALADDDRFALRLAGTFTLKGIRGVQDLFRLN